MTDNSCLAVIRPLLRQTLNNGHMLNRLRQPGRIAVLLSMLAGWSVAVHAAEIDIGQLERIRQQAGVSAMAVVLVQREDIETSSTSADNKVSQQRFTTRSFVRGVTDWQSRRPVDGASVFRLGSVSKMFTGLTLLRAQARGLIDLERPLREWVDKRFFDNPWQQSRPLTVAQLMEHTAGWYDMSGAEFDHSDPRPVTLAQALVVRPASRRSHWPPGIHSEYSNSGAGLAAYALEQASGQMFENLAQRLVFQPLAMGSADYRLSAKVKDHLVQGYDRDGHTPIPYWHILYRPAGGLNVVPRDMAAVIRMLLRRGKVGETTFLTPQQVQRLEQPRTTLAAREHQLTFGYGLGIYATQHQGHTLYGHGGDADGYLSHLAYSPRAGRGYFVVITAFNHLPLRRMKAWLNDWVIADTPRPKAPPRAMVAASILAAYAGEYHPASTRFPREGWRKRTLWVLWEDGKLYTREGSSGRRRALVPVTEHVFRRPWQTTATAAFIPREDGSLVLQGGMGNWVRPSP